MLNNKQDKNFIVPWENYKNTFLLSKLNELLIVKTKLEDIIKIT